MIILKDPFRETTLKVYCLFESLGSEMMGNALMSAWFCVLFFLISPPFPHPSH